MCIIVVCFVCMLVWNIYIAFPNVMTWRYNFFRSVAFQWKMFVKAFMIHFPLDKGCYLYMYDITSAVNLGTLILQFVIVAITVISQLLSI